MAIVAHTLPPRTAVLPELRTATATRPRGPRRGRSGVLAIKLTASVLLAAVLLAVALPRMVGASWLEIGHTLSRVSVGQLLALGALWIVGLSVHTVCLSAAMPGLSHRRSLMLNLTGSFVSNLLPMGGAAGTVANYSMARSWGFGRVEFARWAVVTNIWDTLTKLALPAIAIGWLARTSGHSDSLAASAGWSFVALLVLAGVTAGLFGSDGFARGVGDLVGRAAVRLGRAPSAHLFAERAASMRRDTAALVSGAWGRLTFGKAAYAVLQAALCWSCLAVVGIRVEPAIVFAAFAMERLLSMAVLTPGATGFVEVGMAGVLVALGTEPAAAAAGVLLYRAYTFAMEIPVGGLGMAWWLLGRRR